MAEDELLAPAAQLPELPPTPDEKLAPWVEELLLQLYAIAIFGEGIRIESIPATDIVRKIVQIAPFIRNPMRRKDKKIMENYTEESSRRIYPSFSFHGGPQIPFLLEMLSSYQNQTPRTVSESVKCLHCK